MTQVATVTWVDPIVGAGQSALASLVIYAAVDTAGAAGPLTEIGRVSPGVQTFTSGAGQLTSGALYYFSVKALDVNGLLSQQSNWAGPVGPVGGPSAPTGAQATLG